MGKKPFIALFGLIGACVALTGCGKCCQDCHQRYQHPPTFASKPAPKPDVSSPMVSDNRPAPDPVARPEPTGTMGFTTSSSTAVQQTSATTSTANGSAATPPVASPTTQNALSPHSASPTPATAAFSGEPTSPTPLPGKTGQSSLVGESNRNLSMPPRPVVPAPTSTVPTPPAPVTQPTPPTPGVPQALPPISESSSVPPAPPIPTTNAVSGLPPSANPPLPRPPFTP
jgi:hypothetical protein